MSPVPYLGRRGASFIGAPAYVAADEGPACNDWSRRASPIHNRRPTGAPHPEGSR